MYNEKTKQRRLACSKAFNSLPTFVDMHLLKDDALISRLRASYPYVSYRGAGRDHRFSFEIAFRGLCRMKATASGQDKTTTRVFYDRMKLEVLT